jgi:hypothetical protein
MLLIQFAMGIWLLIVSALNLGFLPLVFGVAMFIGCDGGDHRPGAVDADQRQ